MKNILLPTDLSKNAFNAIEYAVQLFENEDCTFHLLNTFTAGAYSMASFADGHSSLMLEEITRKSSESELLEIEKKLTTKFKNSRHIFKRSAAFNLLTDEIIAVVNKRDIDLIVMGTKGATGAREVFLGTNTMFAIKKAKCPIIAVPAEFSFTQPKGILFPTDLKFSIKNDNLSLLKSICINHESHLNILNVHYGESLTAEQGKLKNDFAEFLENIKHDFHTTEDADLVDAVEEFQRKQEINFLVMIQNKHSFFENLLFKPVIKQMVYHTNLPFMVIPSVELMES